MRSAGLSRRQPPRRPAPPAPARPDKGLYVSYALEWCGHRVEGIPVPDADGRWRLILVEGEASY